MAFIRVHLCHLAPFGTNFYRSWLDSPRLPPRRGARGGTRGEDFRQDSVKIRAKGHNYGARWHNYGARWHNYGTRWHKCTLLKTNGINYYCHYNN